MVRPPVIAVTPPPYDEVLYGNLVGLAQQGQVLSYTEIFGYAGRARAIAGRKLQPICEVEHEAGRPILTAVVVGVTTRVPGKLASSIG